MSEHERTLAEAREAIEDARKTVRESTLLAPEFRETAHLALDQILAQLNDGSMPVQTAIDVSGRLMDMVLVRVSHTARSKMDGGRAAVAA